MPAVPVTNESPTDESPTESAGQLHDLARAKINLSLAVSGRRADGYHDLESLVAFARHGDHLSLQAAESFSFQAVGPFASALGPPEHNLVVRALHRLAVLCGRSLDFSVTLDKRLPVAAGIGGGSADAAAAVRLALRYWNLGLSAQPLARLCRELGADLPVCYESRACWMGGAGEKIDRLDFFPACPALLVNPGVSVATGAVFDQLRRKKTTAPPVKRPDFASYPQLIARLHHLSNDLQAPALSLHPVIGTVLEALSQQPGVLYHAMSGSGATCFALFSSQAGAREAAHRLWQDHNWQDHNWWVCATDLC